MLIDNYNNPLGVSAQIQRCARKRMFKWIMSAYSQTPHEVHVYTVTVVGICRSLLVLPCKAPPPRTHTPPPALMHFNCPHPLFLYSSSPLPPATTTSLSFSAALPLTWHLHSSSAPCAFYLLSLFSAPNLVFFPPHLIPLFLRQPHIPQYTLPS